MKNIRHHSIIVTSNDRTKLETLRLKIGKLYNDKMEAKRGSQLVSPLIESLINNFSSFFIAPDGSKEGYDASDDCDRLRKMVVELIENENKLLGENIFRYAEIFYGDDQNQAKMLNHN